MIAAMVVAVHALLSAARPGGIYAYIAPSVCWALVAIAVLGVSGLGGLRAQYRKTITFIAVAVAVAQIFIMIDVGLITGFAKSPVSFTPMAIAVNVAYVSTGLLGMELSRAYLMRHYGKRRPVAALAAVTLLYAFVGTSFLGFLNLFTRYDPLQTADYLGSNFLPVLSESLLASYLALLGGPVAFLAYRAPLEAFEWFLPILPDLTWGYKALLGVVIPMVGFVYVNQAVTVRDLRAIGARIDRKDAYRLRKREKEDRSSLLGWTLVSVVGIALVWFSTGLLGVFPTIPLSGSMRPALEVGDIAILVETPPRLIEVGDIINYRRGEAAVLHRVHEIRTEDGRIFVTKGDANTAPDRETVSPEQIRGKVVACIPKLGWASIYAKEAIARAIAYISSNQMLSYGASAGLVSVASIYAIQARRNQRRRFGRREW